ncbi:cation diffusion facilitator family transporter [Marinoscillum sp. 108]|uniref:cation diffusion facilitator family transporter n=1 Tax=Marinoscillum sp. 108 TaxID=2653151 RepID=UPI0012F221E9|nr:cation diffusion facilitator family transporter [Marinoscillum sp. 108]VXD11013.1 Cobalt-zinc-cadmium efflux system protein [Marinoscillum sp. 108]
MAHDHHHAHGDHSTSKIRIAFFINLGFSVIELIGGLYTSSVAILSDALHDLGDSMSLGVSWYFQKVARKGRDKEFSYGYRRFSVLGAVINSLVLVVGSILILTEAIPRLFDPTTPDAQGMIYLAIGGILANGLAAYKLHGGHSLNERAVYLHLLEDVLGWVATLIAALIMLYQDWPIVDSLLAIFISLFILFNVYKNLKKALKIILQGTPEEINPKRIDELLRAIPKVISTHDCHIWSMDGQYHILSIHLVVEKYNELQELSEIKQKAKDLLKKEHIDHATIEFETEDEKCDPC